MSDASDVTAQPQQAAPVIDTTRPAGDCAPFDANDLRLTGLTKWLAMLTGNPPPAAYGLLRTLLPVLRVPGWRYLGRSIPLPTLPTWVLVTRRDDVEEVMSRDADFGVPYAQAMRLLIDGNEQGTNFILGLDDGEHYRAQLRDVMRTFRRDDAASIVAPLARDAASRIVGASDGRLDAIAELVAAVPIDICERYYGVHVPPDERASFAQWTIAMSGYIFGPPFDQPRTRPATEAGACHVRRLVDDAISRAIDAAAPEPDCMCTRTVLARLACEHLKDPRAMPRNVMRAFMMGMITGFVPTNIVAAGHILEMLLTRPDFLAMARDAAANGDDDRLSRCLFEAMRFKPLNPGNWRICRRDCTIARGTWREKRIRKGAYVMAGTQSAMFDPRRVREPRRFDPDRAASDSLLFGYGLHWCVGRFLADAQITQTLKALLVRRNLRRAEGPDGRLRLLALFPEHLTVEFDP